LEEALALNKPLALAYYILLSAHLAGIISEFPRASQSAA
jgi:hypothetical protein